MPRPSYPEAAGLRHLACAVPDVVAAIRHLTAHGVACEPVRGDELTGRRFTFFADPDGLPPEFYEVAAAGGAAPAAAGQPSGPSAS